MAAEDAFLHCTEAGDCGPRAGIDGVDAVFHAADAQLFEGMGHEEQLAFGIDFCSPVLVSIEGGADFEPLLRQGDIEKAGTAENGIIDLGNDRVGHPVARMYAVQGIVPPGIEGIAIGTDDGDFPEAGIIGSSLHAATMVFAQEFEADELTGQRDGID